MEEVVTFKEALDRSMDFDLKKVYMTTGGACRPAVTLATVGKAISGWTTSFEQTLLGDSDREKIVAALQELKLTGNFVAEA